jgi:hypothetical protein
VAILFPDKFLFLGTPRSGSTCTHNALKLIPGATLFSQHLRRSTMIEKNIGPYRGEPTFLVVRNPYDALVSWWLRSRTGIPFAEFIATYENPHFVNDGRLFWLVEDDMEILRYENLQEEVDRMLAGVGLDPVQLPNMNVTRDKDPWLTYYGPREADAANVRFGDEIIRYGYRPLDPASLPIRSPE